MIKSWYRRADGGIHARKPRARVRTLLPAVLCLAMSQVACSAVTWEPKDYLEGKQHSVGVEISDLQGNVRLGTVDRISGTNVSVAMTARGLSTDPSPCYKCTLFLGNDMLADGESEVRADPPAQGASNYIVADDKGRWTGRIVFDTTAHLGTGTGGDAGLPLEVVLSQDGTATKVYSRTVPGVRLYNMAYAPSNGTDDGGFDEAAIVGRAALEEMNHSTTPDSLSTRPVKSAILGSLPCYTACFMPTHGLWDESPYDDQVIFMDCVSTQYGDLTEHGVASSKVLAWPNGKSSTQPHYNLVFIHACNSSGDAVAPRYDMARAFGIVVGENQKLADRAYLGWRALAYAGDHDFAGRVLTELAAGKTIQGAVNAASQTYPPMGTYVIFGDRNATLHGVYCGSIL